MFITLRQASDHLRLDLPLPEDPEDDPVEDDDFAEIDDPRVPDLRIKMDQAENIVIDYLKADPDESPSPWSDRDLSVIQSGVLLLLSALWDDAPDRTVADYLAPNGAVALLLARLRDPVIA